MIYVNPDTPRLYPGVKRWLKQKPKDSVVYDKTVPQAFVEVRSSKDCAPDEVVNALTGEVLNGQLFWTCRALAAMEVPKELEAEN